MSSPHKRPKRRTLPSGRNAGSGFVKLDWGLLDSPAWRALSPRAVKALLAIWRRHNGYNNGQIGYGQRDLMALLGCGTTTAVAVFDELVELGFIKCRRASSFDLKTKEAREWAITAEWENGMPAERTFKLWQPTLEKRNSGPEPGPNRSRSETRGEQMRPRKRRDGSRGKT